MSVAFVVRLGTVDDQLVLDGLCFFFTLIFLVCLRL